MVDMATGANQVLKTLSLNIFQRRTKTAIPAVHKGVLPECTHPKVHPTALLDSVRGVYG